MRDRLIFRFLAVLLPTIVITILASGVFYLFLSVDIFRNDLRKFVETRARLDLTRAEIPLLQDIKLAKALANSERLYSWAQDQSHNTAPSELMAFATSFTSKNAFLISNESKKYFYFDETHKKIEHKYDISENRSEDKWYFDALNSGKNCSLNVNYDRQIKETKVWVNCLIRGPQGSSRPAGLFGTGVDLTEFINLAIDSERPDTLSMYIDRNRRIQAHPDIHRIWQISKSGSQDKGSDAHYLFTRVADRAKFDKLLRDTRLGSARSASFFAQIDNREKLVGLNYSKALDWHLLTIHDPAGAVAKNLFYEQYLNLGILLLFTVIGLSSILALIVGKLVIKPVRELDIAVLKFQNDKSIANVHLKEGERDEISRLKRHFIQMAQTVEDHTSNLEEMVKARTLELEKMATTDPLTGISNRRSLFEAAERECRRALRQKSDLTVAVFDLDHFKLINDNFGHAAGDQVLKEFANLVRATLRDEDIFGRMGGEEFVAVIVGSGLANAHSIVERIRLTCMSKSIQHNDNTISFSVSAGLALWRPGQPLPRTLEQADEALYRAKKAGRNRVEVAN